MPVHSIHLIYRAAAAIGPQVLEAPMKKAVLVARILLGLVFFVFGLNGLLHFLPMQPIPRRCRNPRHHHGAARLDAVRGHTPGDRWPSFACRALCSACPGHSHSNNRQHSSLSPPAHRRKGNRPRPCHRPARHLSPLGLSPLFPQFVRRCLRKFPNLPLKCQCSDRPATAGFAAGVGCALGPDRGCS